MSKHTPGPWRVEPEAYVGEEYYEPSVRTTQDASGMSKAIAIVRISLEGSHANARLIAAAPDMLESLKRGRRKLATYTALYSGDTELVKLLAMWDAAIALAEPKEPHAE